ncbi:hypothetical protein AB733_04835 [Photobacterium swingsii]|uniref:PqqD family protein n=1 Tax=Photobacterium swingsii TaxID=680026 RepID=A0A0J8Y1F1_9GAMM|nr:PqqD family protein [Photobacterium swingsii]KMV31454.1 hypothetical protein AB733_04835 [Photobacterium swingsii]PSW25030.1 PqqD family protein [Photobacterium swingsii]
MSAVVFDKLKSLQLVSNPLKVRDDGEFLIAMNESMELFYFKDTAKDMLLKVIESKPTVQELLDYLLSEYDVSKELLIKDVIQFVRDLQWQRLISMKCVIN